MFRERDFDMRRYLILLGTVITAAAITVGFAGFLIHSDPLGAPHWSDPVSQLTLVITLGVALFAGVLWRGWGRK